MELCLRNLAYYTQLIRRPLVDQSDFASLIKEAVSFHAIPVFPDYFHWNYR